MGVEKRSRDRDRALLSREREQTLKLLSTSPVRRDLGPIRRKAEQQRTHNPGPGEGPTTRFKGKASEEGSTTLLKKKGLRRTILAGLGFIFGLQKKNAGGFLMLCFGPQKKDPAPALKQRPCACSHIAQALLTYVTAIMFLQNGFTFLCSAAQHEREVEQ